MGQYKDYIILIPIAISLFALWYSRRNTSYAKINLFNTIQKMMLDKAKDCNQIYSAAFKEWYSAYKPAGGDSPQFSYTSTINEVYISVILLENTLEEFKIPSKVDFFILQFWLQLSVSIRSYLRTHTSDIAQSEEIKQRQYLFKKFDKAVLVV